MSFEPMHDPCNHHGRREITAWWAAGLLGALAAGCTLELAERVDCRTSAECRVGFDLTSVCGEHGYCEPLTFPRRCDPFPADLQTDPEYANAILYGMMADLGLEANRQAVRAATLAIELVNGQDGLVDDGDERPFGLVACDYQSDADGGSGHRDERSRLEAARETARFLADVLEVPAILGPTSSTETEIVYVDVTRPEGTLLLSPRADAASLARLDTSDSGLFWRTVPSEQAVLREIVRSVQVRGLGELAIIAQDGVRAASATLLQTLLNETLEPDPIVTTLFYRGEGFDLVTAINEAAELDVQEIVFLGDHLRDTVQFLEVAVGDSRFDDKSFVLDAIADDPALLTSQAEAAFGAKDDGSDTPSYRVRVVRRPHSSSVTAMNFRNRYRAEYGGSEDPLLYPVVPAAWDGIWMLMLAQASPDSEGGGVLGGVGTLSGGLRALSSRDANAVTSLDPSSWRGAQEQLRSGQKLDIAGASGELDYDLVSKELLDDVAEVNVIVRGGGRWLFALDPTLVAEGEGE